MSPWVYIGIPSAVAGMALAVVVPVAIQRMRRWYSNVIDEFAASVADDEARRR